MRHSMFIPLSHRRAHSSDLEFITPYFAKLDLWYTILSAISLCVRNYIDLYTSTVPVLAILGSRIAYT